MIPYSDGIAARWFPIVNVALIAANFAVFLFYELPDPDSAIRQASFLRGAAGGHVVPNPLLSQGVQLDDEIGNRFALIALSRLTDEQRDELSRPGAAVISIPGNGLDRWLRRAGAGVAIVRPDRTVMQAGRSVDALATALPPFTTESEL